MQINQYLKTNTFSPDPTDEEKLDLALKHLDELIKIKGETVGIREARRHLINYTKGMPNAAELRAKLGQVNSREQAYEIILRLKEELPNLKSVKSFNLV